MRIIIATIMLALASQAQATCYKKAYSNEGEELVDAIAHLTCTIDEQRQAIEKLSDEIDHLRVTIDAIPPNP